MRHAPIPGLDRPVPRLIQGTAMIDGSDLERDFALLDAAFEKGLTAFDTGHQYAAGDTERTLGAWIEARGVRDRVVVITKGAHHSQDRRRVTPFDIASDLHDSLARLRTDTLDLWLLHRDDPSVPVGPIVEALDGHRAAGRIRAYGGSNWSHRRLAEANAYARAHGLTPFVASSPHFSLAEQVEEPWRDCVSIAGPDGAEARAWTLTEVRAGRMALLPWSSLSGGFFSGRIRPGTLDDLDDPYDRLCARCYANEANFARLERVERLAHERGFEPLQLALAWVLEHPLAPFALIGPRTPDEIDANLAALELRLSPEDLVWLESGEGEPAASREGV